MNTSKPSPHDRAEAASLGARKLARSNLIATGVLLAVIFFAGPSIAPGAAAGESNWPQWRGPLANGVAPQGNPPTTWSETENVKWKVKIPGRGTGTPIIWGNQIFIQTAIATGKKVEPPVEKKVSALRPVSVAGLLQAPADPPPGGGQRRGRP